MERCLLSDSPNSGKADVPQLALALPARTLGSNGLLGEQFTEASPDSSHGGKKQHKTKQISLRQKDNLNVFIQLRLRNKIFTASLAY